MFVCVLFLVVFQHFLHLSYQKFFLPETLAYHNIMGSSEFLIMSRLYDMIIGMPNHCKFISLV